MGKLQSFFHRRRDRHRLPVLLMTLACWLACPLVSSRAASDGVTGVPLHYVLARGGQVSINIYDADGHVVRELLHAASRQKGDNVDYWDGLDADGKPVATGSYKWKLLGTQGLRAEYLFTLGTDNSPLYTPWPGNHGGVVSLASDAGGFYVAAGCGEATPLIVKQTLDGKFLWSMPHWLDAWAGIYSMASNGKVLYAASAGKIYRFNALTGEQLPVWKSDETAHVGRVAINGDQLAALRGPTEKGGPTTIDWIDESTGTAQDSAVLPHATDLKITAGGEVFALSDGAVVALTRADKTPRPIIDKAALDSPFRLALDTTTGDILVAENSHPVVDNTCPGDQPADGNQVKRFSATGKLLQTYGAPGGRAREGRYLPASGFFGVYDIVSDGQGGFLTTEPVLAPRRTDRWDRDGKLVHEWYGGQMYANFACMDPDDPSIAWMDSHWGELMQVKIDYAAKSWKVLATYRFAGLGSGLIGNTYHGGGRWFVRRRDGVTYLARGNRTCVLRVDEKAGKLIACMASTFTLSHDWPLLKNQPTLAALRTDPKNQNSYLWFDANGDGEVQPDEVHLYSSQDKLDWEVMNDAHLDPKAVDFYRWARSGAPYYSDADHKVKYEPGPPFRGGDNRADVTRIKDAEGNLFAEYNTNGDKPFGTGWWGGRVGGNRVEKWSPDGRFQWAVGEHARASKAAPGECMYFWNIAGATHGCVVVSDCDQSYEHVWDGDGLWVGRLLDNPDLSVAPASAYQLCGENMGSYIYTASNTGEVYLFGATENSTPVYRITGWDGWEREQGDLTVTPEQAQRFTARVQAEATDPSIAHFTFVRNPIRLDGDLKQFKDIKPVPIMDGDQVRANLYLAWNQRGLYLAWDVNTDAPWQSTSDSAQLAFQGGAAVDVNLGPLDGPGGANRTQPAAGDMRVVAAPRGKKTISVEYMPVLPPNMNDRDKIPATFETGQGKVTYDRVCGLVPAWIHEVDKPRDELTRTGYIVMMYVPMRNGMDLWPGERFRFDTSVILANPEGTRSATRLLWHSTNPADKMTEDTYYESLLRPADWGIAQLD